MSGLTNGKSYTFTVKAITTVGSSAYSIPSTPIIPLQSTSSVSNLSASVSDSTVGLRFTSVAGASIYRVTWTPADNGGTADFTPATAGTVQNISLPGLVNATNYVFSVNTIDAAGNNAGLALVTAMPGAVPDKPTSVTAAASDQLFGVHHRILVASIFSHTT
jgi:hypothetical protein